MDGGRRLRTAPVHSADGGDGDRVRRIAVRTEGRRRPAAFAHALRRARALVGCRRARGVLEPRVDRGVLDWTDGSPAAGAAEERLRRVRDAATPGAVARVSLSVRSQLVLSGTWDRESGTGGIPLVR